jgi:hypothetical protein
MRDKRFADRIAFISTGFLTKTGIEFDLTEKDRDEST